MLTSISTWGIGVSNFLIIRLISLYCFDVVLVRMALVSVFTVNRTVGNNFVRLFFM